MGAQLSLGIEVINAACAGAALLTLVLVVRRPKAAARAGAPGARRVALEPCEGCVVSGVGLGLPGTGRKVFCGANAAALLRGECLIEPLGDDQADALLARRVVQLQKSKDKGPTKVPITRREQTVGVSARLGDFDLSAEYGVPKALAQTMGKATQIAVAAGLEALKDAGLVADVAGDDRWKLPEALRDGTGVVYATSFPALDAAVAEVGRYGEYLKPSRQSAAALIDALEAKLGGSGDVADALDALRAAAGGHASPCGSPRKPSADGAPSKTYTFDRKFLFKVLVLGNSQLAQLTGARGPNLQTNAACAGTTQAVGVAQDLLRAGRCDRVVVISGDDASGDALMPWVGNGFNALGAASTARDAATAARPFDNRRNGMVVGAAACALVIERAGAPRPRPPPGGWFARRASTSRPCVVAPRSGAARPRRARCRVLETLYSNSAYHGAAMCGPHIASELEAFLRLVERKHGVTRKAIAERGAYLSHETGTHATPSSSCAHNEISALRACFGDELVAKLVVVNTKALTGHPMAVGVEDVVAALALSQPTTPLPPCPPGCVSDANLGVGLALAARDRGGPPIKFALRFAAGFGSQVAFVLYSAD